MRRRRLAAELRRLRSEASLSIDETAARLKWPGSKVSRIENRQVGVSPRDLRKLLDLYGVNVTNGCSIVADGSSAEVRFQSGGTLANHGTMLVENGGVMQISNAGFTTDGAVTVNGTGSLISDVVYQ